MPVQVVGLRKGIGHEKQLPIHDKALVKGCQIDVNPYHFRGRVDRENDAYGR